MRKDDFDYAIENTQVIVAPERQIATFGSTSFNFYLISELMDHVDQVRVRNGKIHAERPQILTPEHYCRLLLEGFGEKAQRRGVHAVTLASWRRPIVKDVTEVRIACFPSNLSTLHSMRGISFLYNVIL